MHRAARTFRTASARSLLGAAVLALVGACGRQSALESGLNKDFVLADQLQQRTASALVVPQDSMPVAAPAPTPAPAREVVRTRVVTRTVSRMGAPRTDARATAEPAPSSVAVTAPAPAAGEESGAARNGTYDAGHVVGGEVIAAGSGADVEPAPAGTYGAGSYGTSAPGTSTPVYRQAHAERDAIVGTLAGAIIGAAASHGNRAGGALIGAVAGGALGAVYGHSADRTFSGYPTYAGTRASRGYRASTGFVPPTYRSF